MDEKILESIKGKVTEDEFKGALDTQNRKFLALGTENGNLEEQESIL